MSSPKEAATDITDHPLSQAEATEELSLPLEPSTAPANGAAATVAAAAAAAAAAPASAASPPAEAAATHAAATETAHMPAAATAAAATTGAVATAGGTSPVVAAVAAVVASPVSNAGSMTQHLPGPNAATGARSGAAAAAAMAAHGASTSSSQTSAATPQPVAAAAGGDQPRKISCEDIQLVQNLIERCLQLYMNEKEVMGTLQQQAKIEPNFTMLVWQKLEEQNSDFFRAYYVRLQLKDQIQQFNSLLEQHAMLVQKLRSSSPSPAATAAAAASSPLTTTPHSSSQGPPTLLPSMPPPGARGGGSMPPQTVPGMPSMRGPPHHPHMVHGHAARPMPAGMFPPPPFAVRMPHGHMGGPAHYGGGEMNMPVLGVPSPGMPAPAMPPGAQFMPMPPHSSLSSHAAIPPARVRHSTKASSSSSGRIPHHGLGGGGAFDGSIDPQSAAILDDCDENRDNGAQHHMDLSDMADANPEDDEDSGGEGGFPFGSPDMHGLHGTGMGMGVYMDTSLPFSSHLTLHETSPGGDSPGGHKDGGHPVEEGSEHLQLDDGMMEGGHGHGESGRGGLRIRGVGGRGSSEALDILSHIPRNFSLSDLTADFQNHHADGLLEMLPGSPQYVPTDEDVFLQHHGMDTAQENEMDLKQAIANDEIRVPHSNGSMGDGLRDVKL